MKKEFLLGVIIAFAIATLISTEGTLLYGTLLFATTLIFGKEVHKDEKKWKNNRNLIMVISYINLFIHYLYKNQGGKLMDYDDYIEKLDELVILSNDITDCDTSLIYPYEYCLIKDAVNLLLLAKEGFKNKKEMLEEEY